MDELQPANALYLVQGEISCIVTEMKRSIRSSSHSPHEENPLISCFTDLRDTLHNTKALSEIEPIVFLSPFLELVRSEETTGRITGLALTSINKFIAYGFIDCKSRHGAAAVESIADAVTHARFVGTDPESDEVVLMKILYVLRTLLLSPSGSNLTNESVCEIMQSCFRICFETRLSKLLRRTADHILVEMVQLLFSRLPQFKEDAKWAKNMKKLTMRASGMQKPRKNKHSDSRPEATAPTLDTQGPALSASGDTSGDAPGTASSAPGDIPGDTPGDIPEAEPSESPRDDNVELSDHGELEDDNSGSETHMVDLHEGLPAVRHDSQADLNDAVDDVEDSGSSVGEQDDCIATLDFINPKGIRFIPKKEGPIVPYGLPAIRELFRFLVSIMNPTDRQNSDEMSYMGIYLLTIALETAVDHLPKYASLMALVKDELCFNLFRQLHTEKVSLFAAAMNACFLLFESMRSHLKFQLEMYLSKVMELIVSDSMRVPYDVKEIALQGLVQLWRIPGLVTELYLNYDCDVHCSNLFEDITKLLSKNAFPVTGLHSTHVLSLDALLTVLESVEAHCHTRIMAAQSADQTDKRGSSGNWRKPQIRPNRMVSSQSTQDIPPLEVLHARKQEKQVYQQAVELFNQKPKQAIAYLKQQGYLDESNTAVVSFLKDTPKLSKAFIGEYISRKDNPALTDAYMRSFNFVGTRLDVALRMVLETFRLPGESPVIEFLIEHFSVYWFESNNEPFANADAAFTLCYAIIMLNVDQHSHNAKKQNIPMTLQQFRTNLRTVNGGADFDQVMLEEIYYAIQKEEIVLPEERTGLVKELYSWKVLLGKAAAPQSSFIHAPTGCYDNELFTIIWGPTIAALSFVFDKSQDSVIVQKAITGFRKCAMISAHYGLSEVFDNIIISLCKFTTFLNTSESSDLIAVSFAANHKAQLAAKTVFSLAHRHGDMLREGWKNILDCMITLYRARLLPATFTEVEDFLNPDGKIKLVKENKPSDPRNDSGVFNAFFTYFSADSAAQKTQPVEEQQAKETSKQVIDDCDLDSVIDDTKFLRTSSLQELIKALITLCQVDELENGDCPDEDTVVFFLELLIRVILQNRDRAGAIWQSVRDHLSSIIMHATDHTFLAERAVIGLLRIAIRLLCREEVACQVLPSLRVLLLMKGTVLRSMSRQLAFGMHLLLETNAANIHSTQDWCCLFTLLEVIGAGGSVPPSPYGEMNGGTQAEEDAGAQSDGEMSSRVTGDTGDAASDRGYTSDSELYGGTAVTSNSSAPNLMTTSSNSDLSTDQTWIMVNKHSHKNTSLDSLPFKKELAGRPSKAPQHNQFSIVLDEELHPHDSKALMKCAEVLMLLVRDAAHITPYNFDSCVHSIRVFVEASMQNVSVPKRKLSHGKQKDKKQRNKRENKSSGYSKSHSKHHNTTNNLIPEDEEVNKSVGEYRQLSLQLLELMHTLHTRASSIFHSWAEEQQTDGSADQQEENICDAGTSSLWRRCWCPLLQGIARLCTDMRKDVRSQALTYLQRALLVQDLNQLTATEWEACFNKVLFPLLSNLLENSAISQVSTIEETRFRAATLLSKVYLQHLQDLLTLPTFTALWLTILDFMDKYMHADQSDQLMEGIPELLKNLLLVMGGMDIFYEGDSSSPRVETQLCRLTCDRLNTFLPALKRELFTVEQVNPVVPPVYSPVSTPAPISPQSDITESAEPPLNTSHTVDLPESPSRDTGSPSPPPSSQVRRPVSPEAVHRSTSPLVHSIVPSAFTVKLHPPLAPPVSMTPPTLLPVNSPIVVPDPTLYSSSNTSTTLPVEGQGLLLFNTATPPIFTRSREEPE